MDCSDHAPRSEPLAAAHLQVASIAVTVWFNYVGSRVKFWITWPVALAGAFITWFFIADLTGLDLAEQVCAAVALV